MAEMRSFLFLNQKRRWNKSILHHWSILEIWDPYEPGSKLPVLGMVIQPLIGNPYNGYITPYYWIDDHPLLYGNNGSLDPGTYYEVDSRNLHLEYMCTWQFCDRDLFRMVMWPFQRTNDLQLGDKNVTAWIIWYYMGVSKNNGTPKWMVYKGKPY